MVSIAVSFYVAVIHQYLLLDAMNPHQGLTPCVLSEVAILGSLVFREVADAPHEGGVETHVNLVGVVDKDDVEGICFTVLLASMWLDLVVASHGHLCHVVCLYHLLYAAYGHHLLVYLVVQLRFKYSHCICSIRYVPQRSSPLDML